MRRGAAGSLRDRIARRIGTEHSERGVAMLTAILFMIIMAGLTTVIVSVVLGQVAPAYLAQKSTTTVYASQAGMQATLNLLRASSQTDAAGKIFGNPATLPCSVKGNVDAQNDGVGYTVTITYYSADPAGQSKTWLADASHIIPCSPTSGLASIPKFALLVSDGSGPGIPGNPDTTTGDRSIAAIYQFLVSTANLAGGRIYDYGNAYCLDAVPPTGFATAQDGSKVQFLPARQCTAARDATQLWIYDTDYEIKLASTTVNAQAGLCIKGPVNSTDTATQSAILRPCLAKTDPGRWNELWSWTGSNSWQGQQKTISAGPSTWYLATGYAAGAVLTNKLLQVTKTDSSHPAPVGGFAPTTTVGAGAAGYTTNQLVNYEEFGRCADVTDENILSTFLISYPCKQDPTGTGVNLNWNHKWYYQEPQAPATSKADQQITLYDPDVKTAANMYCLTMPSNPASGALVMFKKCITNSVTQQWTRIYNSGVYAGSYLITDHTQRLCLEADSTQKYTSQYKNLWSELVVATCDGSGEQKWNAPPTYSGSGASGYKEIAG